MTRTRPDAPDARSAGRPWTLQRRLMVTIIGIVALMLIAVGVATSAILGGILQQTLDSQIRASVARLEFNTFGFGPADGRDAAAILLGSRAESGFLLAIDSTAAFVDGYDVVALTDAQTADLLEEAARTDVSTVTVDGVGTYRLVPLLRGDQFAGFAGLPLSGMQQTIAAILVTVGLVTAAGLVVLAIAIALIIRRGLRPLRAVADTASRVAQLPLDHGDVSIADRVPAEQSDDRTEIGQVGAALNTLLDHVDSSLEARQRNEARMRSFVADASHELRTPLASIRGYSELSLRALRRAQGPDQASPAAATGNTTEAALERIQAQSLRMTTLVEDLLLLARLDEGQELVYGTVDLTRIAIDAVGDAQAAGPEHRWTLDIDPDPVLVAGDETRIHQVVANLLANARTHTAPGTEVTVRLTRDGHDAVLTVHDDGPGIDPEIADELFERFSRADRSRARKTGGTGLGLSIARAIVEAHRGSISVRSRAGDTTFEVRLPAQPTVPTADDAPTGEPVTRPAQ